MKRRDFFRNGSVALVGSASAGSILTTEYRLNTSDKDHTAKNIIFLVSDGMSTGTLNMADMLLQRKEGRKSRWLKMYNDRPVKRALMDTSSASSLVTDSAAASSSWGGGRKVPNGSLNVNADGSYNTPIWQKFKKAGKAAGCVTTVPVTHATPAGFCVHNSSRSDQSEVALQYLEQGFEVLMGGGLEYFSGTLRKDGKDVFALYKQKGYTVARNRKEMEEAPVSKPLLGVYSEDGLPYALDHLTDEDLKKSIPTLAEMAGKAIGLLSRNKNGFVLQIEGGRVDWAAHGNDIGGLLYDQIAFDEAVGVALDFAEKDGNTLVIVTTDHGNSNPGLFYGKEANKNFDRIQNFRKTNSWILNNTTPSTTVRQLTEQIEWAQGIVVTNEQATELLSYYKNLSEEGIYNPRHLPFKPLAQFQTGSTSVGWGAMDHSGDYVELAMTGPGAGLLKPFIQNTELHYLMLEAAGVKV